MARQTIDLCLRLLKKSSKSNFGSYSVRNSVLIILSYLRFGIVAFTFFPTTFLEIAVSHPLSSIQIIECTFILNAAGKKTEIQHVHLIPILLWQTKCWWIPPYCGIQQGWILRQTNGKGYVLGKNPKIIAGKIVQIAPCKATWGNPYSGIPGTICLRNLESWVLESVIQLSSTDKGTGIQSKTVHLNRGEKSLRHIAMVAKFSMTANRKSGFALLQTSSILFNFI